MPALRESLARHTRRLAERIARNKAPHRAGYARVDALGNILNEVLATDLGIPENARPADAPVSYPVMWDAHQQDFVQWNGSAPNAGPGPLLRNIGEVLGVFGTLEFEPRRGRIAVYRKSSADVEHIKQLEEGGRRCSARNARAATGPSSATIRRGASRSAWCRWRR